MTTLRSILAVTALSSLAAAQQLSWVEGATAADLTLRTVPASQPAAAPTTRLTRLELLPIEITNRTLQQQLRSDVARLVVRRGLRSVELPANGRLLRYRRDGGRWHGFLWIEPDGTPTVVLEVAGIGSGGTATPFTDRLGVARDGRHALASRVDGSLDVLRLDGGTYASTGSASRHVVPAFAVDPISPTVGVTHAWFATEDERAWRLALGDGAVPVDLTPPGPAGSRVKEEFAPSADGMHVVFLHGPNHLFSMYLAGTAGPALRLPTPIADYEEPGYLPETPNGPRLLLNDDATRLLYVDGTVRDEIFVLDTSGLLPSTHWSGDPNFVPYIGVIVLPVALGSSFVAGIGDPGRFDLHTASAGQPATTNLTRTAASPTAPWTEGMLVPQAIARTEAGSTLAALTPSAGGPTNLVAYDATLRRVLARDLRAPIARGETIGGAADFLAPSRSGDVLIDGINGTRLLAVPPGVELSTSVVAPQLRMLLASAGAQRVVAFLLQGGGLFALPVAGVDEALRTPGGGFALHGASGLTVFDAAGAHAVQVGGSLRHLLSGAATTDV